MWGHAWDTGRLKDGHHHQLPSDPASRFRALEGRLTPHTSSLKKGQRLSVHRSLIPLLGFKASHNLTQLAVQPHGQLSSLVLCEPCSALPGSLGSSNAWSHSAVYSSRILSSELEYACTKPPAPHCSVLPPATALCPSSMSGASVSAPVFSSGPEFIEAEPLLTHM